MRNFLCTLYDIETKIPELYSKENDTYTEPIGQILNEIEAQSAYILNRLEPYFGTDITVNGYVTYPITRRGNSKGNSSYLRGISLIADSTTKEAETYVLEFLDSTNFEVKAISLGAQGSGSRGADFSTNDGFIRVKAIDWEGSFMNEDKIIFSFQNYEPVLRTLCSYLVANSFISSRYVSEQANTMAPLGADYFSLAEKLFDKIITEGTLKLTGTKEGYGGYPQSGETWLGYDVDEKGFLQ